MRYYVKDIVFRSFLEAFLDAIPEARNELVAIGENGSFKLEPNSGKHYFDDGDQLLDWVARWNLPETDEWYWFVLENAEAIHCSFEAPDDWWDLVSYNLGSTPEMVMPKLQIGWYWGEGPLPDFLENDPDNETCEPQYEDWSGFVRRTTKMVEGQLADYKKRLRSYGVFSDNLPRNCRQIVAHNCLGRSWREIADSEELNPDWQGYDTVRKGTVALQTLLGY